MKIAKAKTSYLGITPKKGGSLTRANYAPRQQYGIRQMAGNKRRIPLWAAALGIVGMIATSAAAATYVYKELTSEDGGQTITIDVDNRCNKHPANDSYMFFDISDPLTSVQESSVTEIAKSVISNVGECETLSIIGLTDDKAAPINIAYKAVNPGNGQNASIWTQNRDYLRQKYLDGFMAPALIAVEESMVPSKKDYSPICEGLAAVSRLPKTGKQRVVHVVTDLLQHTTDTSVYRGMMKFPTWCHADMSDMLVYVHVITRGGTHHGVLQTEKLQRKWQSLLVENNRVKKLTIDHL